MAYFEIVLAYRHIREHSQSETSVIHGASAIPADVIS